MFNPPVIKIREYHAIFNQTGTNAPVVTVLHNTLGGTVTWARANTGNYTGTLANGFIEGLTSVLTMTRNTGRIMSGYGNNVNTVIIINRATETPYALADEVTNAYIEIKVYDNN